jgi:4-amino-4-deoxy-L-arabinose transferase-like glycosyltransferase
VKLPRLPIPLPTPALLVLAAAYLFLGLFGHAPWKSSDAIGIGIMHQMLDGSGLDNWLVPNLAGERYLSDGPLYFALAALCAKLLSLIAGMATHDGARLASALCIGAALWLTRTASRQLHGRDEADSAALVLIGCLGLFVHAHEVLPDNGALAGAALAWLGLTRATRSISEGNNSAARRRGAVFAAALTAAGVTIALWSQGPATVIAPVAAMLLAPLFGRTWRSRDWLLLCTIVLATLVAATAAWVAALHLDHPSLPAAWWRVQSALFTPPSLARLPEQLKLLTWAAWPAWPLALWALWERRHRLSNDTLMPATVGAIAGLAAFLAASDVSEIALLPMLPPLALMAGAGVLSLRRGAMNGMAWFGAMTFTLLGGLVWLGWLAMMTGVPAQIALNFAKLEPGYVPRFSAIELAIGLVLSIAWGYLILRSTRSPHKSATFWAAGVTFVWGLTMTLWLPWIDYGKTYAPVSSSLAAAIRRLPSDARSCIASRGLGEAQRAAFDYHGGIVTQRMEIRPQARCPALLVQASAGDNDRMGPGWRRVWEGNRPRDRERFRLYVRE